MKTIRFLFVVLTLTCLAQAGVPPQEWHLVMGNPSHATHDASKKTNYLMEKRYFALSYNDTKGTPNWVSWHLSSEDLGDSPRKNKFDPDTTLPQDFHQVKHEDYGNSGFDRGHMCPHSDRALDQESSFATFIMTNIVPQSHKNNAGAWEALEEYGRMIVKTTHKDLFIVSGPIGQGGVGINGPATTIAHGKVVVPKEVFKVIMVTDRDDHTQPTAWVRPNTRLIAVIMPNDLSVPATDWARYRVSVEAVEKKTGFTFFGAVPAELIGQKKKAVDTVHIPPTQPTIHH